ncbi:membrane hypothetical protein [Nostocoides australiense Ben110]|uniref:Uncharacterized protein n=1 Tax=Nostocoides australiense Ben110 TaxID=1193182 RepID=W6K4L3_9MICO|nr:hypothetical protein [Tetrasphaera australiensis]CCH75214.1 membrane hypothetical protein [Tetrasphaera australiensis Ben110]
MTTTSSSSRVEPATTSGAIDRRLVLSAALMLFVELALIRWLGANVVHLSYFSNFVLLGSFLGIGCGFLISNKKWSIWPVSLPLLAALVVAVREFPVTIERQGSDVIYFTALHVSGPPAWQTVSARCSGRTGGWSRIRAATACACCMPMSTARPRPPTGSPRRPRSGTRATRRPWSPPTPAGPWSTTSPVVARTRR